MTAIPKGCCQVNRVNNPLEKWTNCMCSDFKKDGS